MSDHMSLEDYFKNDYGKNGKKSKDKPRKSIFGGENKKKEKLQKQKKGKKEVTEGDHDRQYREKTDYPTVYKVQSTLKIIFWSFMAFILIRGIVAFAYPPKPIINEIKYVQARSETDTVKAFAEQFVREYLTYSQKDQSEYKRRIENYTANQITVNNIIGWSKVLEANVWSHRKIDESNAVVVIYAKLQQGKEIGLDTGGEPEQSMQGSSALNEVQSKVEYINEVYVKVPVKIRDDNSCVVTDYPIFEAHFEPWIDYYSDDYEKLKNPSDTITDEISTLLDNFFKIYDDGTKDQISYYMLDSQKIKGFEGQYTFDRVETFEAYRLNESDTKLLVNAKISTKDQLGTNFTQKFRFIMVKQKADKELRWYIERFIDVGEKNYQ